MVSIIHKPVTKPLSDKNNGTERDVTKTRNGEREARSGVAQKEHKFKQKEFGEKNTQLLRKGEKVIDKHPGC